ncbi:MAG: hypothetical protein BWX52_01890 [Bacteroidetes bacterium ADurb.Bin013]|nr:MAG: hypothetical protein BWX52_01890 [Bacteroidetes bacterium ADurb.Bin013]
MRKGKWSAVLDLLAEPRNDRSVGAQDVPKAGGHKLRCSLNLPAGNGQAEALDVHLGKSLGGPHNVGGIDGFVRGKEDELFHPVGHGCIGHDAGAFYIHTYGFARIFFHERYMLVGGRVEYDLGFVGGQQIIDGCFVADIANDGHKIQIGIFFFQFQPQVVHGRLGHIHKD